MRSILAVSVLAMLSSVADAQAPEGNADSRDSPGVVTFERGSGRVDPAARKRIENIARHQARNRSAILIVEGHASKVGPSSKNLKLSQERTDAVRSVLVKAGADPNRIVLIAHGEERATRSSKLDRRVEIRSTVGFPDLAMEQADPEIGEDARAAGRTTITDRRTGTEPRGREPATITREGTTVVIVPGGAPSQAGAPGTAVSPGTAAAGGAARTSGGAGTSALTGIGVDPTAEDTATTAGTGPTIVGGTTGDGTAGAARGATGGGTGGAGAGGTAGGGGTTGGGTASAAGGTTGGGTVGPTGGPAAGAGAAGAGGTGAGGTAGAGGTGTGGTASAAGGTTGGGTAGPAGPGTPGGTAGASGGTTGAGAGGGRR